MFRLIALICLTLSIVRQARAQAPFPWEGTVENISADHSQISARDAAGLFNMSVEDQSLKDALKNWASGDKGRFTVVNSGPKMVLKGIDFQSAPMGMAERVGTLFGAAFILVGITFVLSNRNVKRVLFIGQDNRYSNSKCQISIWFGAVIVSYIATVFLRRWVGGPGFLGNVNIPAHLAEISGLSALTFVGAKGVTQSKQNAAPAGAGKSRAAAPSFPADLLQDDAGNFDLGDFQMLVITCLAFAVFVMQIYDFLGAIQLRVAVTLPDVDSTLLAGFGLGQGAYLTKKAVSGINQ